MGLGLTVDVTYNLAETFVTVAGAVEYERDQFERTERRREGATSATVSVGIRADRSEAQKVRIGDSGADDDYTVNTTTDGRLTALSFKSVGVGGRVIGAAASLVAFIGGIAASAMSLADQDTTDGKVEADARKDWEDKHKDEANLEKSYKALLKTIDAGTLEARTTAGSTTSPGRFAASAEARRLGLLRADVQRDLDRIDGLYRAWRANTKTKRTETRTYNLAIADLPVYTGSPPSPAALPPRAANVWTELGVITQVGPPDTEEDEPKLPSPQAPLNPWVPQYPHDDPELEVRWRVPRPVRFWIWRRNSGDSPVLDQTYPSFVVDGKCLTSGFELDSRLFGDDSGQIEFGDLGMPTKIVRAEKGALGILADALGKVPEQITSGLESASKSYTAANTLLDAPRERALAALKRRVEVARNELDEQGLAATAERHAELKSLEQQVSIAEANAKLAPDTEIDILKEQLALVETRAALATAERTAALDAELAEVRSEIARLEARVKAAELRAP